MNNDVDWYAPRPWSVDTDPNPAMVFGRVNVIGANEITLATVFGPTRESNAHLIAAAPDLLEALETVANLNFELPIYQHQGECFRVLNELRGLAVEAVAKARGRSR